MADEIVVEASAPEDTTESAAAEALADVALVAIEATAERVEELTLARAEVSRLQGEVSRLDTVVADLAAQQALCLQRVDVLANDVSGLAVAVVEVADDIQEQEDVSEGVDEVEALPPAVDAPPEIADVAEAEASSPAVIPPTEHHDRERAKRRLISL